MIVQQLQGFQFGEHPERHARGTSWTMNSTTAPACPICGESESLKCCGSCKRVSYCSREHQRQHWKVHRTECTFQSKKRPEPSPRVSSMVVVVEIKSGQGNGLTNAMVEHLFDSLGKAKSFIQKRLGYSRLEDMVEFTEMPFLTQFMKFSGASLFVDTRCNAFPPQAGELIRQRMLPLYQELKRQQIDFFGLDDEGDGGMDKYLCYGPNGAGELNGMAIFLGCDVGDGLRFLKWDAFFIGTTAQHSVLH